MLLRPRPELRRSPRQERAAFTVRAVLEAAQQLVVAHGVEGLKMAQLAEVAGVSPGTLYQYFGDRSSVLLALMELECQAVLEELSSVAQRTHGSIDQLLSQLALTAAQSLLERGPFKRALHQEYQRLQESGELVDMSEDFAAALAKLLSAELEQEPAQLMPMARNMVWAADGLLEGAARQPPRPVDEIAQVIVAAWRGLLRHNIS